MNTDIESKTGFPVVVAKGNEGLTEQTYCRQFAGQLRGRQDDVPKVCEHENVDSIQETKMAHIASEKTRHKECALSLPTRAQNSSADGLMGAVGRVR